MSTVAVNSTCGVRMRVKNGKGGKMKS